MDRAYAQCHKPAVASRDKADKHGRFHRDFQLVGRQYLVQPPLHGLRGKLVGTDATGNRYYVQSKGIGPLGVPRRWVIYRNLAEASQLPPEWHGWMHYMVDTPPTEEDYTPRPAEAAPHEHDRHAPGLSAARQHPGHGKRPKATGDYKPWQPDEA